MIDVRDGVFRLQTAHTSYWFALTPHGHLEHLHYGRRLPLQDASALRFPRPLGYGASVVYSPDDQAYSLDALPLEFSGIGQGDYRLSPCELHTPDGFDVDFVYRDHRILDGVPRADLAGAHDGGSAEVQTLEVDLLDERAGLRLTLRYTVFPEVDVISRRTILRNIGTDAVEIGALASLQLDLPNLADGAVIRTFDGGWAHEAHAHDRPVSSGAFVTGSTTGASSNRHNPGFLVFAADTDEVHGEAYAVNLVYSGNHSSSVERDGHGSVRVLTGIQPQAFRWPLQPGERFETPEAVLAYSDTGMNELSDRMHRFVRAHITPRHYRDTQRPIVFNSWEAAFFDIDEERLHRLASQAAQLGGELFVIDDGWFTGRGDDTAALGDYAVDAQKFPGGMPRFVERIEALGMRCGIWVEPEMVSENSDLHRAHPDWVLRVPGKAVREGRHQQVLDLCNPDVRDHLVAEVGAVLDANGFAYVKWDMNRHIADAYSPHVPHQGMAAHAYVLGLYDVLDRIFGPRPHVLLEMCSSGGNRFDLGMLRYAAMIWASDDTDPIERLEIQQGLSHLYPLSTISAHVSAAPNQQTLRDVPLSTRFNVAAFGCLGYEYDLDLLTEPERAEIAEQIAFYTRHRALLQFGRFRRGGRAGPSRGDAGEVFQWQVDADGASIVGRFQRGVRAVPERDILRIAGLQDGVVYQVQAKPQRVMLARFGHLVSHLGAPAGLESLPDGPESYHGTGELLAAGIRLAPQYSGTGYHPSLRMLGDHGSTLYVVTPEEHR